MDVLLHFLTNDHGEWQMLFAILSDSWPFLRARVSQLFS